MYKTLKTMVLLAIASISMTLQAVDPVQVLKSSVTFFGLEFLAFLPALFKALPFLALKGHVDQGVYGKELISPENQKFFEQEASRLGITCNYVIKKLDPQIAEQLLKIHNEMIVAWGNTVWLNEEYFEQASEDEKKFIMARVLVTIKENLGKRKLAACAIVPIVTGLAVFGSEYVARTYGAPELVGKIFTSFITQALANYIIIETLFKHLDRNGVSGLVKYGAAPQLRQRYEQSYEKTQNEVFKNYLITLDQIEAEQNRDQQ